MNNGEFGPDIRVVVGKPAPDFVLTTENREKWSLADQIGNVTVLLFYPKDETLVCTKQMCSLRDNWETYLETKAAIVGISPGSPDEHKSFSTRHNLPLSLLVDENRAITNIFGKHWLYPINFTRAVVVIDAKGIVRSREVMLRAFRPKDTEVITSIYAARGDALADKYKELRDRIHDSRID
ncbi:MAG: redoxin domain-containing protein [Saprospiraceae bacterium]|nr:redoxin domain-containing protein [Pyrinomonadaceae bacterium]